MGIFPMSDMLRVAQFPTAVPRIIFVILIRISFKNGTL